jgi:hypothetical protein
VLGTNPPHFKPWQIGLFGRGNEDENEFLVKVPAKIKRICLPLFGVDVLHSQPWLLPQLGLVADRPCTER